MVSECSRVIMLNVPIGTEVGIDLKSWNIADNFRGIKLIPPGFHYVHYSAVNDFGELAPKVGFLHTFNESEFVVKQWDKKAEDLSSEAVPEEMVQRMKENSKDLDRYLGFYPYDVWKQWTDLTSHINPSLVERCSPVCGFVRSALELEPCSDAMRPRGGALNPERTKRVGITVEEKEKQLLPDLKPKPGTELRLSKLPDKNYPDGATPSEITQHSLDSSYALNTVLNEMTVSMDIIGELQLAFVCFLVGQSLDAFEHWKQLICLICSADSIIPERRDIFMEFMKALEVQLTHVPEDTLCDIVDNSNFVYQSLRKLFANIEANSYIDDRMKIHAVRFRNWITAKFLWDFSNLHEEDDDEAPVLVFLE